MSTEARPESEVPLYIESLGGALIDAARISVMGALALLPSAEEQLIILPGEPDGSAEDAAATVQGCLTQAMQWLDAAREHSAGALTAKGAPPTSFHSIGGAPR